MSLQIVALGSARLAGGSGGDLYTTPEDKTAIVKGMRFVNTDTAEIHTISIYYKPSGGTARLISPAALSLMPGMVAVDDQEITMEEGDKIQGIASTGDKVDFVLSGVERDV